MSRLPRLSPPKGWADLLMQFVVLAVAIFVYQLGRGLADAHIVASDAIDNARDIVAVERHLGIFIEPSVQHWTSQWDGLQDVLGWVYLNVQTTLTLFGLFWVYFKFNEYYGFVRNMFFTAFLLACILYIVVPTAPPRLLPPEYGFTDPVQAFHGVRKVVWAKLANDYAAMPSMHIGFSVMIGLSLSQLVQHRWARVLWRAYPGVILLVIVATGNHFLLDAVAGAVVAGIGAIAATALGRIRPEAWAWTQLPTPAEATT